MSTVACYSYVFNGDSKGVAVSGFYSRFRPVVEYSADHAVQCFIEKTWRNYQGLKGNRKLSVVIHYLLECSRLGQPIEIKFLFLAIALESLKSTYAHNKGYNFDRGFLKATDEKPKCKDGSKCVRRYYSFRELLSAMFSEYGMSPDLGKVIGLRNEVFHNGLSKREYKYLESSYDYAQDIIREYLLRLLGYEGDYMIYSSGCRIHSLLTRA